MLGGGPSFQLFRIAGIRVGVHPSWFLVLFLWIAWLQSQFADVLGTSGKGFTAAVIAVLLFFGSILLHELGHAFAARREGIGVAGVDLFFFGGVMRATRDSETPGEEFRVAAAGPAVTLVIAVLAALGSIALDGASNLKDVMLLRAGGNGMVTVIVSFLATINIVLLLFNLIPAFPLDGGRIARSVVWKLTGDRHRATRFSAFVGQAFAIVLIGYGFYVGFSHSNWGGALWYIALGWILGSAARGAVVQSTVTTRLEGVTAADIMDSEPVTIGASLPIERAYEEFFLRYQGWPWFAVVEDDGRFAGLAYRAAVEHAAHGGTGSLPVRAVVAHAEPVRTDTSLEALWGSEPLRQLGALMAVDAEGHLRGVVTVEQVSRALQARLAPS